jgi:hypothetical protein
LRQSIGNVTDVKEALYTMEARTAGATTFLLGACTAVLAAVTLGYFLYYGLGFSRLQILHAALVAAAIISGALVAKMMKRAAGD